MEYRERTQIRFSIEKHTIEQLNKEVGSRTLNAVVNRVLADYVAERNKSK